MIPTGMRMRAATAKARARGFILSGAERPHLSERATVHSLTCSKDRSWLTCAALRIHTFAIVFSRRSAVRTPFGSWTRTREAFRPADQALVWTSQAGPSSTPGGGETSADCRIGGD